MEINKAAQAASSGAPTAVQLEAINNLAKAHLTAQQVYVFSLRLCDDQVDRDFERFDSAALPGLAKLFIGKTGIVDHKWSSDKQVARIFQTEVVREDGAEFIKAWAYIRRGDANDEIIAEGNSSAVLGNPLTAVSWLANKVESFGVRLRAGDIILPGTATRAIDISPGDNFHAEFDGLGSVTLDFK